MTAKNSATQSGVLHRDSSGAANLPKRPSPVDRRKESSNGKNRARDRRETKALAYLKLHGCGSAVDIGNAAVEGEPRARKIPWRGKEAIGLSIGVSLAKRGMARSTRDNRFKIAPG